LFDAVTAFVDDPDTAIIRHIDRHSQVSPSGVVDIVMILMTHSSNHQWQWRRGWQDFLPSSLGLSEAAVVWHKY
jgi:hypothetical protein